MITLTVVSIGAILLVWAGYPLAVRLLGTFASPRISGAIPPGTSVSVILASYDDFMVVRARVLDLLATEYAAGPLEIIVALDVARLDRRARQVAELDPRVTVVDGDAPGGKAATLNAAVRAARHEVLVFADTAQRFASDAVGALVAELADPELGAVSGMLDLPGASGSLNPAERYWRYERWLRRWEARLHSCVGVTGAIYAMRRELWSPLPAGLILDDVYVPMRLVIAGWRVGFTEHALARDIRRFAPAQEYRRKVRTLTGNFQVCAWLPGILNPFRNPLWLQFVFHKLLRLLTPYFLGIAALGGAWVSAGLILAHPFGVQIFLPLLGGAVLLLAAVPRARRTLAWAAAMQGSIVVATVNGIRGRWNVWQ